MNPLLVLREELVCLIILVFLLINGRFYKLGKDHGNFLRMCTYATVHVLFDVITVLTVNNTDTVPAWANYAAHIIFYLSAILFSQEFLCYLVAMFLPVTVQRKIRIFSYAPIGLYLLMLPLLRIDYLVGNGTQYSYGPAAFVGYGVAMIFFLSSAVIVVRNYRKMAPNVKAALVPMLLVLVVGEVTQIVVPELLFTGGGVTIIAVGFFFSLENPAEVFKQKLLLDALTGVKSRHGYEIDMERMEAEFAQDRHLHFGLVFFDINNLKAVNDLHGHLEGDFYIGQIAQTLSQSLKSAEAIYRMGGDEFMAVYRGKDESVILRETEQVQQTCVALSKQRPYHLSVAIGYAISDAQYPTLRDVLRVADYLMYKNKADMKKHLAFVSPSGSELNITGLTDRIFDAFAATGDRNYLTLCNVSTNVSRWSKSAVDYFGLPGEFIYDCASIWMDYIHPDDRADYQADITAVFSGKKKYHDIEYRARNKNGEYVMCTCRGTILKGKSGEPDLFAATLVNHGIAESVDPVTGLHNEEILLQHVETLIKQHASAGLLTVGIYTFSRINMLYGYTNGNDVLRQFVATMKRILKGKGTIFRMDGIKFFLCLPGSSAKEVAAIYKAIQDAASYQIKLNGLAIPLRLSGGACMLPSHFEGSPATIRNSIAHAHDRSKNETHGKLIFAGDITMNGLVSDYGLLACIHKDTISSRSGFYLKYQPILNLEDEKIVGAEALLRWRSNEYGEVGPDRFVPWLENDPSFFQLGKWILQQALTDAKGLLDLIPDFMIKVNVTVLQLENERFNSMVLDALQESGFPPHLLCLELTERCRDLDADYLESQINFFHRYGIRVALDDVGSGFSSLSVLLRLPVDEVKLDKSFITDIRSRVANQIIVHAVVDAANRMGYQSCLEGIEDFETYQYLKEYGATSYQGYYFSKPILIGELKDVIQKHIDEGRQG